MHNLLFEADNMGLFDHGTQLEVDELNIVIAAGRDEFGDLIPGGLFENGEMTAYMRAGDEVEAIFPGRIELQTFGGNIVVENRDPFVRFNATRVYLDGNDITDRVTDLSLNVCANNGVVRRGGVLEIYRERFWTADEIEQYVLL